MIDLIGKKFGKLTVEKLFEKKNKTVIWQCRCECGKITNVSRNNLSSGHTKSCGCLKNRSCSESNTWGGYKEISLRTWSDIKNKAVSRKDPQKRKFLITIKDAWDQFEKQNGLCALSGLPISLKATKGNYGNKTASLDRIDSKKGYVLGNIQWVHKTLNIMKRDYSDATFVEFCGYVTDFQRIKNVDKR
jgi:hypothetical protein